MVISAQLFDAHVHGYPVMRIVCKILLQTRGYRGRGHDYDRDNGHEARDCDHDYHDHVLKIKFKTYFPNQFYMCVFMRVKMGFTDNGLKVIFL